MSFPDYDTWFYNWVAVNRDSGGEDGLNLNYAYTHLRERYEQERDIQLTEERILADASAPVGYSYADDVLNMETVPRVRPLDKETPKGLFKPDPIALTDTQAKYGGWAGHPYVERLIDANTIVRNGKRYLPAPIIEKIAKYGESLSADPISPEMAIMFVASMGIGAAISSAAAAAQTAVAAGASEVSGTVFLDAWDLVADPTIMYQPLENAIPDLMDLEGFPYNDISSIPTRELLPNSIEPYPGAIPDAGNVIDVTPTNVTLEPVPPEYPMPYQEPLPANSTAIQPAVDPYEKLNLPKPSSVSSGSGPSATTTKIPGLTDLIPKAVSAAAAIATTAMKAGAQKSALSAGLVSPGGINSYFTPQPLNYPGEVASGFQVGQNIDNLVRSPMFWLFVAGAGAVIVASRRKG